MMTKPASFITLANIDSTSNFAMEAVRADLATHGMAWFAKYQSAGRGQQGKKWESAPGENIIMSIALQPGNYFQGKLFHFNALISLTCLDFINAKTGLEVKLKWPNDLYIQHKKVGGILIENTFRGNTWNWAVVGIGINVSQSFLDNKELRAVSIVDVTGEKNDAELLAKELHLRILKAIDNCNENIISQLNTSYNKHLYKKDNLVRLKNQNVIFETMITGVDENGFLITRNNQTEKRFRNGEVEWIHVDD